MYSIPARRTGRMRQSGEDLKRYGFLPEVFFGKEQFEKSREEGAECDGYLDGRGGTD